MVFLNSINEFINYFKDIPTFTKLQRQERAKMDRSFTFHSSDLRIRLMVELAFL